MHRGIVSFCHEVQSRRAIHRSWARSQRHAKHADDNWSSCLSWSHPLASSSRCILRKLVVQDQNKTRKFQYIRQGRTSENMRTGSEARAIVFSESFRARERDSPIYHTASMLTAQQQVSPCTERKKEHLSYTVPSYFLSSPNLFIEQHVL